MARIYCDRGGIELRTVRPNGDVEGRRFTEEEIGRIEATPWNESVDFFSSPYRTNLVDPSVEPEPWVVEMMRRWNMDPEWAYEDPQSRLPAWVGVPVYEEREWHVCPCGELARYREYLCARCQEQEDHVAADEATEGEYDDE